MFCFVLFCFLWFSFPVFVVLGSRTWCCRRCCSGGGGGRPVKSAMRRLKRAESVTVDRTFDGSRASDVRRRSAPVTGKRWCWLFSFFFRLSVVRRRMYRVRRCIYSTRTPEPIFLAPCSISPKLEYCRCSKR